MKLQLRAIDRAGKSKRREIAEELRVCLQQARDKQTKARERLRAVERDLFGDR